MKLASLEASKRLYEAGIILETEFTWGCQVNKDGEKTWKIQLNSCHFLNDETEFPAPSMAEVWRELPQDFFYKKMCCSLMLWKFNKGENTEAGYWWHDEIIKSFLSANPVDALIDLLIWVRNEEGRK